MVYHLSKRQHWVGLDVEPQLLYLLVLATIYQYAEKIRQDLRLCKYGVGLQTDWKRVGNLPYNVPPMTPKKLLLIRVYHKLSSRYKESGILYTVGTQLHSTLRASCVFDSFRTTIGHPIRRVLYPQRTNEVLFQYPRERLNSRKNFKQYIEDLIF